MTIVLPGQLKKSSRLASIPEILHLASTTPSERVVHDLILGPLLGASERPPATMAAEVSMDVMLGPGTVFRHVCVLTVEIVIHFERAIGDIRGA